MSNMEVASFICSHVFEKTRPILFVCNEDGEFQFLCGDDHPKGDRPRVVGIGHIVEQDPALKELMELPSGWFAERDDVKSPWRKGEI